MQTSKYKFSSAQKLDKEGQTNKHDCLLAFSIVFLLEKHHLAFN